MIAPPAILLCDSREPPWPVHPWRPYFPPHVGVERATLETGDFALKGSEDGAVVERKTAADLLACIAGERGRFEKELLRSRYAGRFIVVVEASLPEVLCARRGLHPHAITGTLAAWTRRFCPIVFAGSPALAADFALRFLVQPVREAGELVRRVGGAIDWPSGREIPHVGIADTQSKSPQAAPRAQCEAVG